MTWTLPVICITRLNWSLFVGDVGMFSSSTRKRAGTKPSSVFMKGLLAVDNSDVSCDVETKQPPFLPFLCSCCVVLDEVQEGGAIFLTPFQLGIPTLHLVQAHCQVIKGGNTSGKFLIMPHHQFQLIVRVQKSKSMKRNVKFQIKLWKVIMRSSVASHTKDLKKSILHSYFKL